MNTFNNLLYFIVTSLDICLEVFLFSKDVRNNSHHIKFIVFKK